MPKHIYRMVELRLSLILSLMLICRFLSAAEPGYQLNVNFGAGIRVGPAVVGSSANDVWNLAEAGTNITLTNLVWANSNSAPVSLTYSNLTLVSTNGIFDAMINSYLSSESWDTNNQVYIPATLTLSNIPGGTYNLYLYGLGSYYSSTNDHDNESFRITVGTNSPSEWRSTVHPGTVDTNWVEGTQYVCFTNVSFSTNEVLIVELGGGYAGRHNLNGLQLVDFSTTNVFGTLPSVTFQPEDGTELPVSVTLNIPGHSTASIFYSLDGADPTIESEKYVSPLSISNLTTIKAFGTKAGYGQSIISSATYPWPRLPMVSFAPSSGSMLSLTLNLSVEGHSDATIRYSFDGTTNGMVYTGPFVLGPNMWSETGNTVAQMSSGVASGYQVEVSSGLDGWKAFDGTLSSWTATGSSNEWIELEFPSARRVATYALQANANGKAPQSWTLEGSVDGTNYSVLDIRSGYVNWTAGERREFSCASSGAYICYRLFINQGNLATDSIVLGEWEMMEALVTITAWGAKSNYRDSILSFAEYHAAPLSVHLRESPVGGNKYDSHQVLGRISAGYNHNLVVRDDGKLWGWGINIYGQLGVGTTINQWSPVEVTDLSDVLMVSGGSWHSLGLKNDGTVWAWGNNLYKRLGDGTLTQRTTPVQTIGVSNAVMVAAGYAFSLALLSDGTVMSWGSNTEGKLGDGTDTTRHTPVSVVGIDDAVQIAAGESHSLALASNGSVWAWGRNANGQLGDGTTTTRFAPVLVSGCSNILQIDCGGSHSLALTADSTIYAWGLNSRGQLGDGTTTQRVSPVLVSGLTNVVSVSAGLEHSLALKIDGTVWAWGKNSDGRLGIGNVVDSSTPVQVIGITNAVAVSAGEQHSLVLLADGTLVVWGDKEYGVLGNGEGDYLAQPGAVSLTNGFVKLAVGVNHTLALDSMSRIFGWGANSSRQLNDGTVVDRLLPVAAIGGSNILAVASGRNHSLVVVTNGTIIGWGSNDDGQLGDGTYVSAPTNSVQAVGISNAVAVAAGDYHSLSLLSDGTLKSWGENNSGRLGDGTTTTRISPVSVSGLSGVLTISARGAHNLAVISNGTVWAWGDNAYGQLGDGTNIDRTTPIQVNVISNIAQVSAGNNFSLALGSNQTVWAWGLNADGQLGDGTITQRMSPVQSTNLSSIVKIRAGDYHAVALKSDGTVWTWGRNAYGQLGDGSLIDRMIPQQVIGVTNAIEIGAGERHTVVLLADGSYLAWGSRENGRLGDGALDYSTLYSLVEGLSQHANQSPSIGLLTNQMVVLEDTVLGINGVALEDLESETNLLQLSISVSAGVFSLTNSTGITWVSGTNGASTNVIVTGSLSDLNLSINSLAYQAQADFFGNVELTLELNDLGNSGSGGAKTATNTVDISVIAVNDAPTLAYLPDLEIGEFDGVQTIYFSGISSGPTNESMQSLTVTSTSSNPSLIPDPTVSYTSGSTTGSLSFAAINNQIGTAIISVVVVDDGGVTNGGVNSVTNFFAVTVNQANMPPTLSTLTNLTLLEDAGVQEVNLSGIGPGRSVEAWQTLVVTAISSNPGLIPNPTISYTSSNSIGLATFSPIPDQNGVATILVVVTDDGGVTYGTNAVTNSFTVTVNPVNDAPGFDLSTNLVRVFANSGPYSIPDFVSGIDKGASNESTQAVSFHLTVTNMTMFSVQPWMNEDGTFGFQLASNAYGTNVISVVLQDDGGTVDGGVDISSVKYFTLEVQSTDVVLEWVNPLSNSTNIFSSAVDLQLSVSDPAERLNELKYYANGVFLGTVTNAPFVYLWSNPILGTNTLSAVAVVDGGINVTSTLDGVVVELPSQSRVKVWLNNSGLAGYTNNGTVSTWYDSSGTSNNFTQSTSGYRPILKTNAINGIPSVQFDGSDDGLLAVTTSATNNFTVFVVAKTTVSHDIDLEGVIDPDAGQRYLFDPRVPNSAYQPRGYFGVSLGTNGVSSYEYNYNPSRIYVAKAVAESNLGTNFNLYSFSVTNGQTQIYSNGALLKSGLPASSNQVWAPFCLGRGEVSGAFSGEMTELIIYDRTLVSSERIAVESYLSQRFGLITNAPAALSSIVAYAVSPTRAVVSWPKSSEAAYYVVERSLGTNDTFEAVASIDATFLTWLDAGLTPGTTARYRVVALNLAGSSAPSNEVEIETPTVGDDFPLSNLRVWLNPQAGVYTDASGKVSAWADQSGYTNHAVQGDSTKRPAYIVSTNASIPAVVFDGSNDGLALQRIPATNNFTLVFLANATLGHDLDVEGIDDPDGGQRYIFDPRVPELGYMTQGIGGVSFGTNGLSVYEMSVPSGVLTRTKAVHEAALGTNKVIVSVVYTNKVPSLYVNGALVRQGYDTTNSTVYAPFRIGVAGMTAAQFQGGISEIMIFHGALTDSERLAAEKYVNVKSGIVTNAPGVSTNVTVVALSASQTEMFWNTGTLGAAGYIIERKNGTNGMFSVIGQRGISDSSYFDNGLSANTLYGYRVKSYSLFGEAAYSDTIYVTTLDTAPMPISGLKIWLNGQNGTITNANGKLNLWYDQSGNGNHARQFSDSLRPVIATNKIGGRSSLYLDGADDGMTFPKIVGTNNFTIFSVVRPLVGHDIDVQGEPDNDHAQKFLFDPKGYGVFQNPQAYFGLSVGTNGFSGYEYNYLVNQSYSARAVASQYFGTNSVLLTMVMRDGQPWLYANGQLARVGERTTYSQVVTPVQFGKQDSIYSSAFGGEVAEVLVYNQALTEAERMATERVLNQKYVVVTNYPSAPVIEAIADVTTDEDTPVESGSFAVYDAETALSELTLLVTSSNTNLIVSSGISINGTSTNRTLHMTPKTNAFGSSLITVYVADTDGNTNATQFKLTVNPVNDSPEAFDINTIMAENTTNRIGLVAQDVDTLQLTYLLISNPTNGVLAGATTNLSYIPNAGFVGGDSFTYAATDGSLTSAVATVTIKVYGVTNRLPVADTQSLSMLEDGVLPVTLTGTDFESTVLHYYLVDIPTNGVLGGSVPNLTYRPNPGFSGTDAFTFRVHDGLTNSSTAVVDINVLEVNDAPTLASLTDLIVLEDASVGLIALYGIGTGSAYETNQILTVSAYALDTNLVESLGVSYTNPASTGTLAIVLRSNAFGQTRIDVVVADDGATTNEGVSSVTNSFYLTIQPVSDSPLVEVYAPTNGSTFTNPTNILLSASASDPDGDLVMVSFYSGSDLLGSVATSPYEIVWSNAPAGISGIRALAVDSSGLVSTSTVVSVMIDLPGDLDYDGRNDWQELEDETDGGNAADVLAVRLARFGFDSALISGERGQLALSKSNVLQVASWLTNAVEISGTNASRLAYQERESDGSANINLREGTLRFWFKPNWGSTNAGGVGPGADACLFSLGDETNGVWGIWVNATGSELSLITGTNGVSETNLVGQLNWNSNVFHQLTFTYSLTNCGFYLDGSLVTNGVGVCYYPDAPTRYASGINIGSNPAGGQLAQGQFDELETFNYQLSSGDISSSYAEFANLVDSDLDGLTDRQEIDIYGTDPGKADTDGDGILDGKEVSASLNPLLADSNLDPDGDGVDSLTEILLGRNPLVYGTTDDVLNLNGLKVFTPLKP